MQSSVAVKKYRTKSDSRTAFTLMLPVLIFFMVFQYYPILKSVVISFMEYGLLRRETPWVGLQNYVNQMNDPLFISALINTLLFVAIVVVIGVVVALILAVFVERTGKWSKLYRTLYFIPVVTSLLATSMIWRWLYASNGLFNFFLTYFGFSGQAWLLSEELALASLIVLTIWKNLGFDMVLFSAGLQAIPEEFYEASKIDGATSFQNFLFITLPQLKPDKRGIKVRVLFRCP